MFYIDKDNELTVELLHKMINDFVMNEQPKLQKYRNYYNGKHIIVNKSYKDKSKVCNKVVTNYCKVITDTYSGYIVGKPVSYSSNDDITDVQEIINYNDSSSEDIDYCANALIYGVAYELFWLDDFSQVRYAQINPLQAFPIYDNTLNKELIGFVRWYKADNISETDIYYFDVYTKEKTVTYKATGVLGNLEFVEEDINYFKDIPVGIFYLSDEDTRENIFSCIIALNDAYNELQSSEIDDYGAWVDAYLTLTGLDADAEDIASMKENRVLLLPEGANAGWLVKNASDTQIENMLSNIKKNIFKISNCPDMSDENFLAQSGTALAYKLVGFENKASGIVARFTKAIQRRIELICNILNLKASDSVWRDINISFVRNLPTNTTEIIQIINSLQGIVSDATLLSLLPFVNDVQAELEAIKIQKENNMAVYGLGGFGANNDVEDTGDEDEQE